MSDMVIQLNGSSLRRLQECDLDRLREWRNHPEVRSYMYTQHEITREEHRAWFERQKKEKSKHSLIFEYECQPQGYLHFDSHGDSPIADWGFYLAPDGQKGMGTKLGEIGLEYGFQFLKLHKICGQALAFNEKSVKFHKRLGFHLEGHLRDHHYDGQKFHDVFMFGLISMEWETTRSRND